MKARRQLLVWDVSGGWQRRAGRGGQGQARAGPGSSESVMVVLMRFLLGVGQGYLCSSVRFAMRGATGFERAIVKVFAPDFKLYHEWSDL